MTTNRRQFLLSSSALAAFSSLPDWLADPLMAQTLEPLRRFDTHSQAPDALTAMEAYRRAVGVMKQRPDHDPTGWMWQANIHGYTGGAAAFEAAFPSTGIPGVSEEERLRLRQLAEQTWAQCPHGNVFFIPWHRVYLFFFERIMQDAAGEPDLALPYWNWTSDRLLPRAFREPIDGSQANNALFNAMRSQANNFNGDANGDNADGLLDGEVDISMLESPDLDSRLEGVPGFARGFGPELEGSSHGDVHVAIGGDMGVVSRAGRDPIFWLHHSNIDRLWASWANVAGHENPQGAQAQAWLDQQHTLIDRDGQLRSLTTTQVLDAALILERGYIYDSLEEVTIVVASADSSPALPAAAPASGSASSAESGPVSGMTTMASDQGGRPTSSLPPPVAAPASAGSSKGVTLSNERVNLELKIDRPEVAVPASGGAGTRLYVSIKDLVADKTPGDNFAIYINLPDGAKPDQKSNHFVGVINFFGAIKSEHQPAVPASGHTGHGDPVDRVIDVTRKLEALRAAGLWDGGNLSITIVPLRGNVDGSAKVRIGGVELFRR